MRFFLYFSLSLVKTNKMQLPGIKIETAERSHELRKSITNI